MPYFVRVGGFRENKGGLGARGYHIWRRGCTVFVEWGPITVRRSRVVVYEWARRPVRKPHRERSVAKAMRKANALIEQRVGRERYTRLPSGHGITPWAVERPA